MKRTKNAYFYMVTISALYFLMILLLHSRIQVELCQIGTGNHKTEVHNHSFSNQDDFDKWFSKRSQEMSSRKNSNCHVSPESRNFTFQTVADNLFYVYTAYLDTRTNITYVRIMSIFIKERKDSVLVFCSFKKENGESLLVRAVKYEMCENHNKRYGGWIMSCPLPTNFSEPCQVEIGIFQPTDPFFSSNNVTLNIMKLSPLSAKLKYAVCIPPLFGNVSHSSLIDFMEFTSYFGAEKFIFYTHAINDEKSLKALEYYNNRSLVTIIPWKLPDVIQDTNMWYHGQLIAHNDCLYRSMSLTNKLAIQDIDELIVPHDGSLFWDQALAPLFNDNVVGLGIQSAFFDPALEGEVLAISSIRRTKVFSRFRTKVLVKPSSIFEVGIHHVSKPLLETYKIISPDTNKVVLHHYRSCLSNYGMNCKDWVIDQTIRSKYSHIRQRVMEMKSIISKLVGHKPEDNAQNVNISQNKLFL